jgi:hypothetical protein
MLVSETGHVCLEKAKLKSVLLGKRAAKGAVPLGLLAPNAVIHVRQKQREVLAA